MKTVTYDETKWKLVPIDSTDVMRDAGGQAIRKNGGEGTLLDLQADADSAWMAMIAEAPEMEVPDPNGAQKIDPPDFPPYYAGSIEGHMSREDLWEYACLVGWRTGWQPAGWLTDKEPTSVSPVPETAGLNVGPTRLVLQVDGKNRGWLMVDPGADTTSIQLSALHEAYNKGYIDESPAKIVVVPNKLVNVITQG